VGDIVPESLGDIIGIRTMSRTRRVGPSATRTCAAANRSARRLFVLRRELIDRQDAPVATVCAETDLLSEI